MKLDRLPDLMSGIYQHYKGPLYSVLGYGHDANNADRTVVVYQGLQLDAAHQGGRLAVRDVEDFMAVVCVNGVCTAYGHVVVGHGKCTWCEQVAARRFVYLGPVLLTSMVPAEVDA